MATAVKEDTMRVENGRLIIDVALSGNERSASGKSVVLFSTHGNVKVGDVVVGLNAYRKA